MKIGLLVATALLAAGLFGCQSEPRPIKWAGALDFPSGPENFYRVNADLYRSARPNARQMSQFEAVGGRSVLYLGDDGALTLPTKRSKMQLFQVKCSPNNLTEAQLVDALGVIMQAPKPLLVCDRRGADSVGAVMASYRIVFDKWTAEDAKEEMEDGGFGFNFVIYPNLKTLVDSVDWVRVGDRLSGKKPVDPVVEVEKAPAPIAPEEVKAEPVVAGAVIVESNNEAKSESVVAADVIIVEEVKVEAETQGNK